MQLSTDEARALAFIACLIGLALLGRWVDRPRPLLLDEETVDIAELRAASERAAEGAGGRASRAAGSGSKGPAGRGPGAAGAVSGGVARRVDLNRATPAELEALPGVGPALAGRIVAFRDSVGRFRRPEQLDSVRGIGPALLARLLPLVQVSP